MEELLLRGILTAPSGAEAEMDLVIAVSEEFGIREGRGSFQIPAALVGSLDIGPLIFETEQGSKISLLVTHQWVLTGWADFETRGALPVMRKVA